MNRSLDERVGFMTTSILQREVKDYIRSSTIKGKYQGDIKWLIVYDSLRRYNGK